MTGKDNRIRMIAEITGWMNRQYNGRLNMTEYTEEHYAVAEALRDVGMAYSITMSQASIIVDGAPDEAMHDMVHGSPEERTQRSREIVEQLYERFNVPDDIDRSDVLSAVERAADLSSLENEG